MYRRSPRRWWPQMLPLASQFAPAVVKQLGVAGFYRERDMLWRVLD